MKAVYPVTLRNSPLYPQIAELLKRIGPNADHDLLVVSCPAAIEAAQTFAEEVKNLFRHVETQTVANVVENSTQSRNAMFRDAVYLLEQSSNRSPWIWMEDAYPTACHWLDEVQEEWNAKPLDRCYLGCVEKTFLVASAEEVAAMKAKNPGLGEGPFFKPYNHHMRFGVYPPDFHLRCKTLNSLSQSTMPFEAHIQGQVAPQCHPSRTLKTVWASVNFERKRHGFEGEQSPKYEKAIRKNESTYAAVDDGTAILHGCRDGSIIFPLTRMEWRRVERPKKRQAPESGGSVGRIAELEAELKEARAEIASLRKAVYVASLVTDPIGEIEPAAKMRMLDGDPPYGLQGETGPEEPAETASNPVPEESPAETPAPDAYKPPVKPAPPKKKRGRPRKSAVSV
jgi:hypothetical protein